VVIVADRTHGAIGEPKILPLEGIGSAHCGVLNSYKVLVKNRVAVRGKPGWRGVLIEHKVGFRTSRLQSAIKGDDGCLVLLTIRLDEDSQD